MTIQNLKTLSDTKISVQSVGDKVTTAEHREVNDAIINEVRDRGVPQIDNTAALATLANTETKTAYVKGVGLFIDSATGVADGVLTFAGVGGRFWVKKIAESPFHPIVDGAKIFLAVMRVIVNGDNTITFSILDDTDHDVVGITALSVPTNSTVQLDYPTLTRVLNYQISPDEELNLRGLMAGASVGLNSLTMTFSGRFIPRQQWNFNGTSWVNGGGSTNIIANVTNAGSIISINRVTSGNQYLGVNIEASSNSLPVHYAGTNSRAIRYKTSGIGYNQTVIELFDTTTGLAVNPDANDKIYVWTDTPNVQLQTQAVNNSSTLEKYFYGTTGTANFWVMVVGK